ncbi:MAG TPA: metalloregulator ArsR/SmtB family transcription factor [Gaiellales bacterium]|jgi:DNA-binding transcriptional ArsR family regulator
MGHGVDGRSARAAIDAGTARDVATAMQALAAPSRVLILGRLRAGASSVGELAAAVGMSQPAVSQQLRVLRNLGLVVGERRGRHVVYELHDDHVAALVDEAVHHVEHLRLAFRGRSAPAAGGRA